MVKFDDTTPVPLSYFDFIDGADRRSFQNITLYVETGPVAWTIPCFLGFIK